jgi:hypothetical protein
LKTLDTSGPYQTFKGKLRPHIRPTRHNILKFLRIAARPVTIREIGYQLDFLHGCIFPDWRVRRVLETLRRDKLVRRNRKAYRAS